MAVSAHRHRTPFSPSHLQSTDIKITLSDLFSSSFPQSLKEEPNDGDSHVEGMIPRELLLPFGMLFALLTVVGVIGNLIVIIAIAGDRKMRKSVMNVLLLNLAVADMCNLLLNTCEWVPTVVLGRIHWILPDVFCGICRYLEHVFLFGSISTQIVVSIERYVAIVHPIHARRLCTRRNATLGVTVAWLFVGSFATPYAYHHSVRRTNTGASCSNAAISTKWFIHYKQAEFLLFYLVPCIVIIFVYSRVVLCLWMKNPQLEEHSRRLKGSRKKNDSLRTRMSVVKMLVACVAVYFLCYSPIQAVFLSKSIFHAHYQLSYGLLLFFNALAMTCSASNPLLYTLFSLKFRRKLKSLLTCSHYQRVPLIRAFKNSKYSSTATEII